MKRVLASILFSAFCSIWIFAQTQTALNSDETWKTYKGTYNEFSVDFPATPKHVLISKNYDTIGLVYRAYHENTFYLIVSCDKSAFNPKDSSIKTCPHFESLNSLFFVARITKDSDIKETTINEGNLTKTQVTFVDSEGFYQVIQRFETANFSFILHTLTEFKDNKNVDKFFKSFQIATENPVGSIIEKEIPPKSLNDFTGFLAVQEYKPTQTVNPSNKSSSTASAKPVKITYKPASAYSLLAREYEITGNVRLRVLFLADGTIGEIEPVFKLPFGLTNNAIEAAKKIKFTPAMRDGKSISSIKTIEYLYSIY